MTVSSLWYNGEVRNASVNYQSFKESKGELEIDYDIEDGTFKELMRTVALGTKAFFEYTPTEEAIKRKIGKMIKKNPKKLSKEDFNNNKAKAEELLSQEELQKPFQKRKTEGDASESGLIKFVQPIYDLNENRDKFPIHSYKLKDEIGEVTNIN